jgi:hypothetical protein
MNLTRNFIDLFVLRGKDAGFRNLRIASRVVLMLAATLLALGAYKSISASLNPAPAVDTTIFSENPELALARRSAGIPLEASERETLALNPEISLHQRLIDASRQSVGIAFQHENPEVTLHQRLADVTRKSQSSEFLATNPEINTARRYQDQRK